jgi:hypothetical protein
MLESILLTTGVISGFILIVMTVLSIFGGDVDLFESGDLDIDNVGDIKFFTFRNLISLFVGLSWGSLYLIDSFGLNPVISIIIGLIIGGIVVIGNTLLMFGFSKLHAPNVVNISELIGKNGTVYMNIPGNRGGVGQINIELNGSLKTIRAITNKDRLIPTLTSVKVVSVLDGEDIVVVEPLFQTPKS